MIPVDAGGRQDALFDDFAALAGTDAPRGTMLAEWADDRPLSVGDLGTFVACARGFDPCCIETPQQKSHHP